MLDPIFLNSTFVFVILLIHDSFFFQIVQLSSIFTLQPPPPFFAYYLHTFSFPFNYVPENGFPGTNRGTH